MNATLSKIIKSYSTDKHSKYISELHNLSKDRLIAIFTDLLTTYINDKNSSTLREYLTVSIAGYTHSINKIGYNGFKHNTAGKAISCEAKPRNFYSQDFKDYQLGKRKSIRKLNGGGNFSDYTWNRFEKDKKAAIQMLISGFIDGKLIYLLEFPFTTKPFLMNLEQKLKKKFPRGDELNNYLRSASFDYKNFIESKKIKIVYCDEENLVKNKKFFLLEFWEYLINFRDL